MKGAYNGSKILCPTKNQGEKPQINYPYWHLDLGLLGSRTVNKIYFCFLSHLVCGTIMLALVNQYKTFFVCLFVLKVAHYFGGKKVAKFNNFNIPKQKFGYALPPNMFRFFFFEVSVQCSCSVVSDSETPWTSPSFSVHHQQLEFAQIYVHRVGDAILPSHPLSTPSPPAFNLCQHQGLFQ